MIEVRDLSKQFPGTAAPAVDGIRFTVNPGEVFGLLGPNGAGKTTTLRMLCTVLRPTGGSAAIAGFDVATQPSEVRRNVGFLSANTGVYDRMTAWEMVEYYGKLNQIPTDELRTRLDDLFKTLQMDSFRDVPGAKMSTGMKQKVSIARALVNDPPVLIFDEPTSGLDVLVQRAVLESIKQLRGRGKTIVFSTHIMREVEKLCDRVAIMRQGKIVACGTLDELRQMQNEQDLEELFFALVS
jgi:sodium transport system ATP-binding protein